MKIDRNFCGFAGAAIVILAAPMAVSAAPEASQISLVFERVSPSNDQLTNPLRDPGKPARVSLAVPVDGAETPFRDTTTMTSGYVSECTKPVSVDVRPLETGLTLGVSVIESNPSGTIVKIQGIETTVVAMDDLRGPDDCLIKLPRVTTDYFSMTTHLPLNDTPVQLTKTWSVRAKPLSR
ncbi:hypothetical protein RAS12_30870 (plasmid) [Achromobacter seleniivolatilans]|uniref:Uncharacterized protein n=1 Tax=Achromobacter seleniivolatilans TaxID=3047478 RepID=A0ABY9MAI6_9BURK|nr:hypothetical protein [Achromobacter sp. R39]WMD24037.1 hypothetical protein RAS12_30870 [Achromobacter sp. R39]